MIIGSVALKHYFPDFPREPKDLDIIGKKVDSNLRIEVLKNPILEEYYGNLPEYIGLDELYTLKISHLLFDVNWNKHIWDVQYLKDKGCQFIEPLFHKLFKYWETIHGKRKISNLEMTAEDFFNNALPKEYEHDHLHELLIKHPHFKGQEEPTYTKILKDGAEVDVCQQKFNTLNSEEKFNLAFEEIAVMSFEPGRYPQGMYWKKKYHLMLKKFLISHAPLFEAVWIIQNHKELSNPPFNHIQFLENAIRH